MAAIVEEWEIRYLREVEHSNLPLEEIVNQLQEEKRYRLQEIPPDSMNDLYRLSSLEDDDLEALAGRFNLELELEDALVPRKRVNGKGNR